MANQFGVSYGFTKKIRQQQLQSGQMERPPQQTHGPASRATEPVKQYLRRQLQAQPDLTLAELGQRLDESMHVHLSKSRLWDVLQLLRLRRKKTLPAGEQDTDEGRERQQLWWEQVAQINSRRLVFLDESGVTTEMTRRYGRAERGERVCEGALGAIGARSPCWEPSP